MRAILATGILLFSVIVSLPAHASYLISSGSGKVHSWHERGAAAVNGHHAVVHEAARSGNVHSKAGASASVAPQYAAAFQALIDDLEAHGAVIKFMGGYRAGSHCDQGHKHPCGMALDVCQYARDVVDGKCSLPGRSAENEIASRHGLFHGAQWCNPDRGHFEAGGSATCGHGWATARRPQRYARNRF